LGLGKAFIRLTVKKLFNLLLIQVDAKLKCNKNKTALLLAALRKGDGKYVVILGCFPSFFRTWSRTSVSGVKPTMGVNCKRRRIPPPTAAAEPITIVKAANLKYNIFSN